jgi:hypothetical protein
MLNLDPALCGIARDQTFNPTSWRNQDRILNNIEFYNLRLRGLSMGRKLRDTVSLSTRLYMTDLRYVNLRSFLRLCR